jgi:hypothetical protein
VTMNKISRFETGTSYIPLACGFTAENKSLLPRVDELSSPTRLNYTLCVNHERTEQKNSILI